MSQREFTRPFLELTAAEQASLLEPLAYKAKYRDGEETGREFFRRIRELTVMGFYSSEIGYRELDNPALRFHAHSPACPHTDDPAHKHLPPAEVVSAVTKIFDVVVIGTGAGGGMAIKTLTEAGLKVCAINAGRRLDPSKDFRHHRKPWDMKFRGFGDPARRAESYRLHG